MPRRRAVLAVLLPLSLNLFATAQCTVEGRPGDPLAHVRGTVTATTTWDPDGTGPLPPRLMVGGAFQVASAMTAEVATFDGTDWVPLGDPPGEQVTALTVYNGEPIAATSPGGHVVRWNGTSWSPIGASGQITGWAGIARVHNGELFLGGSFSAVDGVTCNSVARWNGTNWSALGAGVTGVVYALATWNGTLHVGGNFSSAGGTAAANYALWTGSAWVTGPAFNNSIETLTTHIGQSAADSWLFAGGTFTSFTVGGVFTVAANHVARCPGTTNIWAAMGAGVGVSGCQRLLTVATSATTIEVIALTGDPAQQVWRWTGSGWMALPTVADAFGSTVGTLAVHGGRYVATLPFADVAVQTLDPDLGAWLPLRGKGIDDHVFAQCAAANGDLVIGGQFRTISGVTMNGVARGSANAWSPLGGGVTGGFGVFALASMPNGDVVAGGSFTVAGGAPANNVARWNGSTWSPLGSGANDTVYALAVMPNGDLVAAGRFTSAGGVACSRIARWNGASWAPLGSGSPSQVNALHIAANGDLLAGGNFTSIGGISANRIARWNGSSWSALGSGVDGAVLAVVTMPSGDVVVGGSFGHAGSVAAAHVARWNGSQWSAVGAATGYWPESSVYALAVLPGGSLVACGAEWDYTFSIGPLTTYLASNVAQLTPGSGWQPLDVHGIVVSTALVMPDGTLSVGGRFNAAGEHSVGNVARLASTCPATAAVGGTGCSGDTLTAASLPWANGVFRGTGTGLAPNAVVIAVTGLSAVSPALPLSVVFAEALPGCILHAAPDLLETLVATNGTATSTLLLPNSPPLVGLVLHHQMVPIEFGPNGIVAVTATNALQLTCGIF